MLDSQFTPITNVRHLQDGKEAFQVWKPNLIYVQGGNTFWLYHCIEKGGWGPHIIKACTGDDAAVYCGTSAGAIIMGQSMATACWKVRRGTALPVGVSVFHMTQPFV